MYNCIYSSPALIAVVSLTIDRHLVSRARICHASQEVAQVAGQQGVGGRIPNPGKPGVAAISADPMVPLSTTEHATAQDATLKFTNVRSIAANVVIR
jgi:hypothetical protein